MKDFAWLGVLAFALYAPAGTALLPLVSSSGYIPEASYRAVGTNSGPMLLFGAPRRIGQHTSLPPTYAQGVAMVAHHYSTFFANDEDPISEGGSWIDGKATGLDWADVKAASGLAFGTSLPSKYADPTAVLTGDWGSDQQAEGTIHVKAHLTTCCHEVELRLRSMITPHSISGYEILCSVSVDNPYLDIVRWNGPPSDFTYVSRIDIGCADGDILRAAAVGDVISVYKNGVKVLDGKDDHFASGSPGIGFYEKCNDIWSKLGFSTWTQFGFSRFSATDDMRAP